METKTCSLTEYEIKALIFHYARTAEERDFDTTIERMNYLNRRLKADKKEVKAEVQPNNDQAAVGAVKASW